MKMARLAESLTSIVTIMPRKRRARLKYIKPLPYTSDTRSDREAIWGDFCAVGGDMRIAIQKYGETVQEPRK